MKYLITGGTGFLGTELTKYLLAQPGNEVVILSRSAKQGSTSLRYVAWDGKTIPDEAGPADVVINLAGANIAGRRWSDAHRAEVVSSRVDSAKACVEFIQRQTHKPALLLAGSAVGFYGGDRPEAVDETSAPGNDFMAEVCKKWEAAYEGAGIRTVVLRTGVIFGKDAGPLPEMARPFRFFAGGPLGTGNQFVPWMHVQDWIHAVMYFVNETKTQGIYNVCAPQPLRQRDVAKAIGKALGRPSWVRVPLWAMKLLLGEMAIVVCGNLEVYPKRLVQEGFTFRFADIHAALKDIYSK